MSDTEAWKVEELTKYNQSEIDQLLNMAEIKAMETAKTIKLGDKLKILRKEKAVGFPSTRASLIFVGLVMIDPTYIPRSEMLNEIVFAIQDALPKHFSVPFCAFNSGKDVWIDIGNKSLGIRVFQKFLNAKVVIADFTQCIDDRNYSHRRSVSPHRERC